MQTFQNRATKLLLNKNNFISLVSITLAVTLASGFTLGAETKVSAEVAFTSGWAHLAETDYMGQHIKLDDALNFWYNSANARLKVDTSPTSSVKAYIDADYSVTSLPEITISTPQGNIKSEAGYDGTFNVSKAYAKIKLPWFAESSSRLTAGKQPLSWGFGMYYNAGDILFGADPNVTENATDCNDSTSSSSSNSSSTSGNSGAAVSASGLSDLRAATDWIVSFNMPLGQYVTLEAVTLPPIDTARNSKYGRTGARTIFRTDLVPLENIEISYITQGNAEKQQAALALDGSIWLDYNLCSSITFNTDDFYEKKWNISLALNKIFTIQTDVSSHSLNLRAEGLWYPKAETAGLFAFISYGITDSTSLALNYLWNGSTSTQSSSSSNSVTYKDNNHFAGVSFSWEPIKGLELSIQGLLKCDKPDDFATVLVGVKYKY